MIQCKRCRLPRQWQHFWFGGLIALLLLALAGCGSSRSLESAAIQPAAATPAQDSAPTAGVTAPSPVEAAEEAAEREPEAAKPEPATDPAPQADRPLDQFSATDPATVSLASGRVQLVEFFAHW